MIFNITPVVNAYKPVKVLNPQGTVADTLITNLSLEDRNAIVSIYKKVERIGNTLTEEEKKDYAARVMDLLSNSYQEAYERTPNLVIGKPRIALLKRSCPFYDAMVECLVREEWTFVIAVEE